MGKQYSIFSYQRNLVVMLILLQLLTVVTILALSRINTDRILIDNAYETMAETIAQSADHTKSFIKPAYKTVNALKVLATNNIINFDNIETLEKLFFTELTANESFAGLYIANDNSDFIYMLRKTDGLYGKVNPEEVFQTKIISHKSNEKKVLFNWRRNDFSQTRLEIIDVYDFDPKTRPWYKLATNQKKTSWTKPYIFYTSQERGITIATPFYNKETNQSGVIGIDIEIGLISKFLDRIQNEEYIRIQDSNGNLIADSSAMNVLSVDEIDSLLKSHNSEVNETHHAENHELQGTFKENNDEYLYVHSHIKSNPNEPDWKIFTYSKTYPFLLKVRSNEKRNIVIALTTLLIAIFASLIIARKTSKPIESWVNLASTDNLTRLYNRHFFFNSGNIRYNEYIKTKNHNLSLMMIDLDLFKEINDNYGHNIGDDVLKNISRKLKSLVKVEDTLARFGGEEFILLSKVDSHHQAVRIAERIRVAIESLSTQTSVGDINLTVSIGVYVTEKDREMTFLKFIDTADKALYHSKNNGRNIVSLAKNGEIHSHT